MQIVGPGVALPFQQFELPPTERRRMQAGHAQLLEGCMAGRGFDVSLAGDFLLGHQREGVMDPAMWGGPFGTMPLDHARRFGYKPAPTGAFAKGPGFYLPSPGNLFVESGALQGAELARMESAYNGDGDKPGCDAEVARRIDVDLVDFLDLQADVNQLAREHPQVQRAVGAWVSCMDRAGYRFAEVWDGSQKYSTLPGSREQTVTAVADVRCTQRSRWADYFYAALADYQRQAIDREGDLLEAALHSEQERLAAIEAELGSAR